VTLTDLQRNWNGVERRQAPRFSITLTLTIGDTAGWTRDVSATGVYFTTSQELVAVGAPITFTLELDHADPQGMRQVVCSGTILRVEHRPDGIGVAARIASYDFAAESVRPDYALLPCENRQAGAAMGLARNPGGNGL